jgi:hypothetical protein
MIVWSIDDICISKLLQAGCHPELVSVSRYLIHPIYYIFKNMEFNNIWIPDQVRDDHWQAILYYLYKSLFLFVKNTVGGYDLQVGMITGGQYLITMPQLSLSDKKVFK